MGHLPLQLISSFSTSVKEDEESDGHTLQECATENGVTNGWDIKLPDGQHPLRDLEPRRAESSKYLSSHTVRLNPAELNTTKILKNCNIEER